MINQNHSANSKWKDEWKSATTLHPCIWGASCSQVASMHAHNGLKSLFVGAFQILMCVLDYSILVKYLMKNSCILKKILQKTTSIMLNDNKRYVLLTCCDKFSLIHSNLFDRLASCQNLLQLKKLTCTKTRFWKQDKWVFN